MGAAQLRTRAPLLQALGDPAIALLWAGLATSAIGDQLFIVVLSWVAVGAFGAAAGYLTVLQGATALAALFLGHLADRLAPLRVMAAADLARAAVLALTVAVWLAGGQAQAWTLILSVIVLAAGMSLFRPALQASLPVLARAPALLPAANALIDTTERIARLLGPGLVGMASAVVAMVHLVSVDVASFVLSALAVLAVARLRPVPVAAAAPEKAIAAGPREGAIAAMLRGVRVVRGHRVLGFVLACTGILNGAWYAAFFLGLPLVIARAEPGPEGLAHYALMISAYGSANLLGTLVMGSRALPLHPGRWIAAGNAALGIGIALLGLVSQYAPPGMLIPGLAVASALSAFGGPMQDIPVAVLRQTELPRADLPAAVRAFMAVNSAGLLATLAVMPALFDTLGVARVIVLCGAVILGLAALGFRRFG